MNLLSILTSLFFNARQLNLSTLAVIGPVKFSAAENHFDESFSRWLYQLFEFEVWQLPCKVRINVHLLKRTRFYRPEIRHQM